MTIPSLIVMFQDNTAQPIANGLFDNGTSTYFNATATVTATLFDQQNNPVTGCINVPMSYVNGSNGNFIGRVDQTFSPALGGGYRLEVTAIQGAAQGFWKIPVEIQERKKQ